MKSLKFGRHFTRLFSCNIAQDINFSHDSSNKWKGLSKSSSNRPSVFYKQEFFKSSRLPAGDFIKKKLRPRCFPVDFANFFKTLTLQNTLGRVLLKKGNGYANLTLQNFLVWITCSHLNQNLQVFQFSFTVLIKVISKCIE